MYECRAEGFFLIFFLLQFIKFLNLVIKTHIKTVIFAFISDLNVLFSNIVL